MTYTPTLVYSTNRSAADHSVKILFSLLQSDTLRNLSEYQLICKIYWLKKAHLFYFLQFKFFIIIVTKWDLARNKQFALKPIDMQK